MGHDKAHALDSADHTVPSGSVALNAQKITGLADPTAAQDAATKTYVDALASGLSVKASCRLATATALPFGVAVYSNGSSGVNATLTGFGFGALTVDGVSPSVGDRILVKDQATAAHHGIYTVTVVGGVATLFVLTRATDFDQAAEIAEGSFTLIAEGTANAHEGWVLTSSGPFTVGTTSLNFSQFSAAGEYTAGTGISISGTTIAVSDSSSTPAAIGTAASGTTTNAPSASNHVHPTGAGTPSTQAFSDAAATGSGPAAAMTDHKHAMMSSPLGLPLALTGATAATRYVGGTTSGAPASGTFAVGDFVVDQAGQLWTCVVAGTPGTWIQPQDADPMHLPAFHGLKAWNGDAFYAGVTGVMGTTQQVYIARIFCPVGFTAANIVMNFTGGGSSLTAASSTTVASGSNGQAVNALTATTLNVASTTGFSAVNPSYLRVVTGTGTAILKYTGTSGGNAFTGITTYSGTGTVSTGGSVSQSYNTAALFGSDGTTGTQIGFAADQFGTWTSTGTKTGSLTAVEGQSLVIAAGAVVYVMYVGTGSTIPSCRHFNSAQTNTLAPNIGVSGANLPFGFAIATGAANVIPDRNTLSSNSASVAASPWIALS